MPRGEQQPCSVSQVRMSACQLKVLTTVLQQSHPRKNYTRFHQLNKHYPPIVKRQHIQVYKTVHGSMWTAYQIAKRSNASLFDLQFFLTPPIADLVKRLSSHMITMTSLLKFYQINLFHLLVPRGHIYGLCRLWIYRLNQHLYRCVCACCIISSIWCNQITKVCVNSAIYAADKHMVSCLNVCRHIVNNATT